jgi:hypothetical protein
MKLVWNAITDPDQMRQWYFPMLESFKPEVGFEIQFDVPHNDKIYQHLWKVNRCRPWPKDRVQLEIRRPFRRFGRELRAVRRRGKDPLAPDSRGPGDVRTGDESRLRSRQFSRGLDGLDRLAKGFWASA